MINLPTIQRTVTDPKKIRNVSPNIVTAEIKTNNWAEWKLRVKWDLIKRLILKAVKVITQNKRKGYLQRSNSDNFA